MNEMIEAPISDSQREQFGRVGVLYGGLSAEREVSLQSGAAVLDALQASKVNAVGIDVNENAIADIEKANIDRAFIALHGSGGEDGQIQALLNFMNIPFTGSGVQASAIALDKVKCKQIWQSIGLPTPSFHVLRDNSDFAKALHQLGGEAFVKPCHEGSSIGMSRVNSVSAMQEAYQQAKQYDAVVLAEQFISGPEYTVSIVGDQVLPAIRMQTNNVFYDYEAKYLSDSTEYFCPCGLKAEDEKIVQDLALRAYQSIGCEGWGRVDLMADANNQFYLLEVNTVPGMTSHSLVPMAAKARNISFEQLVVNILQASIPEDEKTKERK